MLRIGLGIGGNYIQVAGNRKLYYEDTLSVLRDEEGRILARGAAANLESQNGLKLQVPIESGKVDVLLMEDILKDLIDELHLLRPWRHTALYLSVPGSFSHQDLYRLHSALMDFGIHRMYSYSQIETAAVGSGYDIYSDFASCIVYIDRYDCTAGLFQNGELIFRSEYFLAGAQIDAAVENWLKNRYDLEPAAGMIETIKDSLFSLNPDHPQRILPVQGLDRQTGRVRTVELKNQDIQKLLYQIARRWTSWLGQFIHKLEVQEQLDVWKRGIVCCGTVFALEGLEEFFESSLGCPVFVCEDPQNALLRGLRRKMETKSRRRERDLQSRH